MAQINSPFFALPPPAIVLLELVAGSATLGFTSSRSLYRVAATPLLFSCVYGIVSTAGHHMRPRWASLLGGTRVAFLLQYLDTALVSKWNFEDQGPQTKEHETSKLGTEGAPPGTLWNRLCFGWNTMWAFRHVNSPYEVKNVPPFSSSDPSFVPPKWFFVGRQIPITTACYLVLDLLALRKAPINTPGMFDPAHIYMISRIGEISLAELKRKALMTTGFAVTFYCIVQGSQSFVSAVAVASGLSKVESWRPAFGSLADAYSLKNIWGKFWHQLLRSPLTGPASAIVHDVLRLPRGGILAGVVTLFLSFTLSAMLHAAAGLSSGAPTVELGVFRFFWTQAFGILIEEGLRALLKRVRGGKKTGKKTCYLLRGIGFVWVGAFLTWSAPAWLYPQVLRPARPGPGGFLPFSVVKTLANLGKS